MYLKYISFLGLIIFSFCFGGVKAESLKIKNPHLYEVVDNDGDSIFILGSVHYGISIKEFPNYLIKNFYEAKFHAYELIVNTTEEFNIIKKIHKNPRVMIDKWVKYRRENVVDDSSYPIIDEEIQNILISIGFSKQLVRNIHNDSCGVVLYRDLLFSEEAKSIDHEFLALSEEFGKEIFELESKEIREKADILDESFGYKKCLVSQMVHEDIDIIKNPAEIINAVFEEYRSGIVGSNSSDDLPSMKLRNEHWIKNIENLINKKGNVFITVGVHHLYGETGLLSLFSKNGLKFNRLNH